MADFIDFPIFTGVSGDLRPWISWLEAFFVREKFKAMEKMNLAQSLLEGEAEAWFYSIQKTLIFYSWKELKNKLLLRFGDFADPDRIRLIAKLDRFLQEIRDETRIQRMKTTSIPVKNTIRETITVVEETSEIVDGNLAERASEKKLVSPYQVPVSSLEPSLSFSKESLVVSEARPSEIVSNKREDESVLDCVKNKTHAYQVFDKTSPHTERLKTKTKQKLNLSLKTWKFKFKNKNLQHKWSQRELLQVIDRSKINNLYLCFGANFGLVRNKSTFQCLRLQKHAHKSRVLYQLRLLHDPGGKKEEHSDDMFEIEVDINNVQRTHIDTVAESGTTTPDNVVPPSTDVITERQRWDEACDAEIDALEGPGTCIVTSLLARCGWLVFDRGKYGQIQWPEIQEMVAAPVSLQLILDDLKSHMRHKWKSKHLQAVFDLQNNPQRFADGGIYVQLQLNGYKTQIGDCLICGDVKFQLKHKWRSKHIHTTSALELYLSSVFPTVTSANSGWLQGLLEQVLEGDDKAYTKIFDKLQLQLPQGMDLQEYADGLTKNFELEAALKDRTADVYNGVVHEYMVQRLLDLLMIGANPIMCSKFGHTTNLQLIVVCMVYSWGICILFTNSWERKLCKDWWFKFKYNIRIGEALRLWNHLILDSQLQ